MSGEHLTREIDEALDEASAWIVRLQDGGSAEEAMAFDAWLETAEANRQAYDKALAVWVSYGALAPQVLAGVRALEHRKARRMAASWRSPLAMGMGDWRVMAARPTASSGGTGSSTNISRTSRSASI